MRATPPHVNELAVRLGVSPSQLSRKFAREVGLPASTYLKGRRVACAQRLLTDQSLTVEEIARRCGFGTATTFHRWFARATGMTPGDFRRSRQKSSSGV